MDTKRWTVRTLDPGGESVVVADGMLLVTGGTFRSTTAGTTSSGIGLSAYGSDRVRRFQILAGQRVYLSQVSGGRAYVYPNGGAPVVVDLASGQVVGPAPRDLPYLIDA